MTYQQFYDDFLRRVIARRMAKVRHAGLPVGWREGALLWLTLCHTRSPAALTDLLILSKSEDVRWVCGCVSVLQRFALVPLIAGKTIIPFGRRHLIEVGWLFLQDFGRDLTEVLRPSKRSD